MSAETILVDLETELANLTPNAKSFFGAVIARLTALETTVASASSPLASVFAEATKDVGAVLAAGVQVAVSATSPTALVVAIGNVVAPVTAAFGDAFEAVEGFVEGLEGKTPAAGAPAAEVTGAAAGVAVGNIIDAFEADWKATF